MLLQLGWAGLDKVLDSKISRIGQLRKTYHAYRKLRRVNGEIANDVERGEIELGQQKRTKVAKQLRTLNKRKTFIAVQRKSERDIDKPLR